MRGIYRIIKKLDNPREYRVQVFTTRRPHLFHKEKSGWWDLGLPEYDGNSWKFQSVHEAKRALGNALICKLRWAPEFDENEWETVETRI